MNQTEIRKTIALLACVMLMGLTINHLFLLLTPTPESPEMARSKAKIALIETEAKLDGQRLYRVYVIALGVIVAGILICFGAVWIAFFTIRYIHQTPFQEVTSHEHENL